jgi:hypothetical protein
MVSKNNHAGYSPLTSGENATGSAEMKIILPGRKIQK